MNNFEKVKDYISQLNYSIIKESETDGVIVIDNEEEGVKNMVVAVADPIVIMEQFLFEVKSDDVNMYKSLLMKNQDIIHGAFTLNEEGNRVFFRDTLQVENLDLNEIEASLKSLSLMLSEYSENIIKYGS